MLGLLKLDFEGEVVFGVLGWVLVRFIFFVFIWGLVGIIIVGWCYVGEVWGF